ncbi:wax ester/triacylglycerol synthase family O-acyltransferase [Lolliginicoccus levis]|uniref:wax ester/triacylglycerol synthase family O-acyltransferase n=1 Tax=Lolliginicoccus levis TaxID=2919542 RepID=UPI00241F5713|nr:wax ester/triacylglycerol synthase family O-acyltransferase [Lolliginicoccus levis]
MRQLDPASAVMLYLEETGHHHHLMSVYVVEPGASGTDAESVPAHVIERLAGSPAFDARVVELPGGLFRPYLVPQAGFDPRDHIRISTIPGDGSWRAACDEIARVFDEPMDLARPLWEIRVLTGVAPSERFPDGASVLLIKVHHAAMDGLGIVRFAGRLLDARPGPVARHVHAPRPTDQRQSGKAALLGDAASRAPGAVTRFLADTYRTIGAQRRFRAALATGTVEPRPVSAPVTRLNDTTSGSHVFNGTHVALADARRCRELVEGATINDVALAAISGGLQRYLAELGEAPAGDLICGVPRSLHGEDIEEGVNKITGMSVDLHNTCTDPVERLSRIHASTTAEKHRTSVHRTAELGHLILRLPPAVIRPLTIAETRAAGSKTAETSLSTVATNMPRGRAPLFFLGNEVLETYSLLPMNSGIGAKHEITSLGDRLFVSVNADASAIPDTDRYLAHVTAAFSELVDAAAGARAGSRS